ncbi:MAG: hypothetical protein HYZ85_04590 [Candidatus Omnitrophica bacterium]|nr:hypothetical protein [Candidatus Omnitrophota bacterium]
MNGILKPFFLLRELYDGWRGDRAPICAQVSTEHKWDVAATGPVIQRAHGFLLIDSLIALTLFGIAGAGVTTSFYQAVKAEARIRESFREYDPIRLTFMRMDQDLRNMVRLREHPFKGKHSGIEFPIRKGDTLFTVEYKMEGNKLYRKERKITQGLKQEKAKEQILFKEGPAAEFFFPYENDDGMREFENDWLDDPYQGLPRAVQIKIGEFEKVVSIPQGRIGHGDEK